MKIKISSLVMLVVLIVGIALTAYGVTGRGIYDNAAAMMGVSKKDAMTYIQDPSALTEMSDVSKIGADNVKGFLKGLGLDATKVDSVVDERAKYEEAVAKSKDRDAFMAYAMKVDETVTEDIEIAEGVRLVHTPGHTPDSMSVFVKADRNYAVAGDAVPLEDNIRKKVPPRLNCDPDLAMQSIKSIVRFADVIVPGHGFPFMTTLR